MNIQNLKEVTNLTQQLAGVRSNITRLNGAQLRDGRWANASLGVGGQSHSISLTPDLRAAIVAELVRLETRFIRRLVDLGVEMEAPS